MVIADVNKYLRSLGLKQRQDFSVTEEINHVDLGLNNWVKISVGQWDNNTWEVFGVEGEICNEDGYVIQEGTLCQYKVYKSLKKAIDYALTLRVTDKRPKPIAAW